jgi:hypothetical protein
MLIPGTPGETIPKKAVEELESPLWERRFFDSLPVGPAGFEPATLRL